MASTSSPSTAARAAPAPHPHLQRQRRPALPARLRAVYATFARRPHRPAHLHRGGELGLPDNALVAFALGADMVNVAREAMMSIGCIQAQKCHTDHCPTGVATQNDWLSRGSTRR